MIFNRFHRETNSEYHWKMNSEITSSSSVAEVVEFLEGKGLGGIKKNLEGKLATGIRVQ